MDRSDRFILPNLRSLHYYNFAAIAHFNIKIHFSGNISHKRSSIRGEDKGTTVRFRVELGWKVFGPFLNPKEGKIAVVT